MHRAPVTSLYVHVPFCARKCSYCAFYSEAGDAALIQNYTDALVREMDLVAHDLKPQTIFFGGGTPSLLSLKQWAQILQTMERLGLTGAAEWTIECNPATVSLDKARLWRSFGVNRISMGVQSLDEDLLDRLGRVHSRSMVFKSYDLLRQAGFENINLDLMFAVPGQTLEVWHRTLDEALALGSEHLACYELIYEEDTPLFHQLQAGEFSVDEDLACEMYEALVERCRAGGLLQYEIANFARHSGGHASEVPSGACQHNINYWRGGFFYGLGPSASGFVDGVRTKNVSNTRLYCERMHAGQRAIETEDRLPGRERAGEIAAFGLRMNAGWKWKEFQERTGFDLAAEWGPEMEQLSTEGLGCRDERGFRLSDRGLRFADYAAERFIR